MSDERLRRHLNAWLGDWPGTPGVSVVGHAGRLAPGWDGRIFPALGVASPTGGVLSVAPEKAAVVRPLASVGWDKLAGTLPATIGYPERVGYAGIFRWCVEPAPLPEAGTWEPADDPEVPEWLRPFGGEVLIARDPQTGEYLAGVGIKRHDEYGRELAVGTAPPARGRGLARRLVAQAARRVLDEGAVPTYQHDPANTASARVADAAGFPDRGWTSFAVSESPAIEEPAAS